MLARRDRLALTLQRELGRLLAPLWIPLAAAVVRYVLAWRIEGARETRREFRRLRGTSPGPLLVCANHLTMADSFLLALALASPWWFVAHYGSVPWNMPERENFATSWWMRAVIYVMKCVPVRRGGDRREIGRTLARVAHLLRRGEVVLIFPEGGRSRKGRVDREAMTYGVGRIVKSVPGCRVLCVYLRGEQQTSYSDLPVRGDRFRAEIQLFEPKSDRSGLRGSVDIARQILSRLAQMERLYFDDRQ